MNILMTSQRKLPINDFQSLKEPYMKPVLPMLVPILMHKAKREIKVVTQIVIKVPKVMIPLNLEVGSLSILMMIKEKKCIVALVMKVDSILLQYLI